MASAGQAQSLLLPRGQGLTIKTSRMMTNAGLCCNAVECMKRFIVDVRSIVTQLAICVCDPVEEFLW